jgi:[ribosomal protein S5]-alanine N-acetyltransferase
MNVPLLGSVSMRFMRESDAEPLSEAYIRNRAYLEPWEPRRADPFFTVEGQASRVQDLLQLRAAGRSLPWVLDEGGRIVGTMTLSNVVLGPFRSASLGYWIDEGHAGRGLATAAVAQVCRIGAEKVGLHRIEASVLPDNAGSQRVLTKSGFTLIGSAPTYLHINGAWRDHLIFQRILHDRAPE